MKQSAFERDTTDALQNMRSAFGRLLRAVPGQLNTPTEMHRNLGIDMKLCWKIHKVIRSSTPLAAGIHVPGVSSLRTLMKAARRRGVADDVIEQAEGAAKDFERIVSIHANDRATFESMVSALGSGEEADRVDLTYRRAGFRAARHAWGMSAKTRLVCRVMQPSEDPDGLDIVTIQGYLGVRKLRADARLIISHARITQDDGTVLAVRREALAPDAEAEHSIAILPQFCTQPLPDIQTVKSPDGFIAAELPGEGMGNTAATTCVVGWVTRDLRPRWYTPQVNESIRSYALVRTPAETLIHDVLVRDGTVADRMPSTVAFAECGEYADYPEIEQRGTCAKLRTSVDRIGRGPSAVHTPEIPWYTELIHFVFDRLGWDGDRFEAYRSTMEYPVMPSMALTMFAPLPQPTK